MIRPIVIPYILFMLIRMLWQEASLEYDEAAERRVKYLLYAYRCAKMILFQRCLLNK